MDELKPIGVLQKKVEELQAGLTQVRDILDTSRNRTNAILTALPRALQTNSAGYDEHFMNYRQNAIPMEAMGIFLNNIISVQPGEHQIDDVSVAGLKDQIQQNRDTDVSEQGNKIIGYIKQTALKEAIRSFMLRYEKSNTEDPTVSDEEVENYHTSVLSDESQLFIKTFINASISENQESITNYISQKLGEYQASKDTELKRKLLEALTQELDGTNNEGNALEQLHNQHISSLDTSISDIGTELTRIDVSSPSTPQAIRYIANTLEELQKQKKDIEIAYKENITSNQTIKSNLEQEINALRTELGMVNGDTQPAEIADISIEHTSTQETQPSQQPSTTAPSSEVVSEQSPLQTQFADKYKGVVYGDTVEQDVKTAYDEAFTALKGEDVKNQRNKIEEFLSSVAKSTRLNMTGYQDIYKKVSFGNKWRLNEETPLGQVFEKIQIELHSLSSVADNSNL